MVGRSRVAHGVKAERPCSAGVTVRARTGGGEARGVGGAERVTRADAAGGDRASVLGEGDRARRGSVDDPAGTEARGHGSYPVLRPSVGSFAS